MRSEQSPTNGTGFMVGNTCIGMKGMKWSQGLIFLCACVMKTYQVPTDLERTDILKIGELGPNNLRHLQYLQYLQYLQ